jgi:tetrahydrodipicolinate N-succinyltransferase
VKNLKLIPVTTSAVLGKISLAVSAGIHNGRNLMVSHRIEDDVRDPANVTNRRGVTIGECSIINSNSFVNFGAESKLIAAAVPVRFVRSR